MPLSKLRVAVVGSGIGSLVAAIALGRLGASVQLFGGDHLDRRRIERFKGGEVGDISQLTDHAAGVALWSNAVAVLEKLGVGSRLHRMGLPAASLALCDADGTVLRSVALGDGKKWTPSLLVLPRQELVDVLLSSVPHGVLQAPGWRVSDVSHRIGGGVRLMVENARDKQEVQSVDVDVLVGADGVASAVRRLLLTGIGEEEPEAVYSGFTLWRGVAERSASHPDHPVGVVRETFGRGLRFTTARIDHNRLYWHAQLFSQHRSDWSERLKTSGLADSEDRQFLGKELDGLAYGAAALVQTTPLQHLTRTAGYERPLRTPSTSSWPLPTGLTEDEHGGLRWGRGGMTLVGNAAHPMGHYSSLGQSVCMGIEDAYALAVCLADSADVPAALFKYETGRMMRVASIIADARRASKLVSMHSNWQVELRRRYLASDVFGAWQVNHALRNLDLDTTFLPRMRLPKWW